MSAVTEKLHAAFLAPLKGALLQQTDARDKPLCVDLKAPHPPRLRVYLYSLVASAGTVRSHEYKIVLRVPGQRVGAYGAFDHADGRFALVAGYRADLDVFVFWDATLHPRFKNGGNVQVRDGVVYAAATTGRAEQRRPLSSGPTEIVLACQSSNLLEMLSERLATTGGIEEEKWATLPN